MMGQIISANNKNVVTVYSDNTVSHQNKGKKSITMVPVSSLVMTTFESMVKE